MGIKVAAKECPKHRVSYAHVFKPKPRKNAKPGESPKYSYMALFDKGADISVLKNAALAAAKDKWGDKAEAVIKHPKFKSPFKDQAELINDEGEQYPGTTPGGVFINFQNDVKPLVLAPDTSEITDPRDFYSGCYAKASLEFYAWEHEEGGRGISVSLLGTQKVADGDPLGGVGARASTEDFEPIADADGSTGGNAADPFA